MRFLPIVAVVSLITNVNVVGRSQEPGKPIQSISNGVLDEIRIYLSAPAPNSTSIAMRLFSATDADLAAGGQKGELPKETKDLQDRGPRLLAASFVAKLKELGGFKDVTSTEGGAVPGGTLGVEGKFTMLDPGSRAKRYFVGFGAGKSVVSVA